MRKDELARSLRGISDMESESARIVSGFFSENFEWDTDEDKAAKIRCALRDIGNACIINERTLLSLADAIEESDADEF